MPRKKPRGTRAAPALSASPSTSPGRGPLIVIGILAAAAAVFSWWWLRTPAFTLEISADRNVLLVTIDTLRADALGSYGGRARTPNLDRLAAGGAQFDFAHAHAVVTLPSHASILTGQLPYEHGIRDNSGYRLEDGTPTLATRLKARGFATGAFIGGFPLTQRFGLAPGFDLYDDQISELQGDAALSVPERPAGEVVQRAVDWIAEVDRTAGKFFGWVHLFDPHSPYAPPEEFRELHDRPYDGEVAAVDRALQPLLNRLETLARPTLVIVTSDHGESLGEHGEPTHGMFAYEATLRVPLIVATVAPGMADRRGRRIGTPAGHIDIAPTVLDAIGGPVDPAWLGSSLRETIASATGAGADRPTYFESMTYNLTRGWAPLRGVLSGREKYIDQPIPELYQLLADPDEQHNLADTHADRRRVLETLLRTYDVAPPSRPGRESAGVAANLRSLGYVSGTAAERTVYTEADDLKNLVSINRELHRADELYQRGDLAGAIPVLEGVIAARPDTADAWATLARAHWTAGDAATAIKALERALAAGVTGTEIRMRLGLYLAESGMDPTRAITLLKDLPDDDAEVVNSLGVAYSAAGQLTEAIAAFRRVLALDPGNGLALQNIAAIHLQRNSMAEAEEAARRAIVQDPALAKAHTTLGVVLARTGRKPEAIETWKRAVTLDRAEFDALYNLIVLLVEARQIDDARAYAAQFVGSAPPARYQAEIQQMKALVR